MLVSIIIPCYNVAPYLARALQSALDQTYPHTEIICVDNNSSDDTWDILQHYRRTFPNKIQVVQEPKQGAPAARNHGISLARGEWIQFLDADDELLPEKIERQINLLQNCIVDVVAGGFKVVRINGKTEWVKPNESTNKFLPLVTGQYGNTVANLFKRSGFTKFGPWSEKQTSSQERELMFRWIKGGARILISKAIGCSVFQRPGSVSDGTAQAYKVKLESTCEIFDYAIDNSLLTKDEVWVFESTLIKNIRDYAIFNIDEGQIFYDKYFERKRVDASLFDPERAFKLFFVLFDFRTAVSLYVLYQKLRNQSWFQ